MKLGKNLVIISFILLLIPLVLAQTTRERIDTDRMDSSAFYQQKEVSKETFALKRSNNLAESETTYKALPDQTMMRPQQAPQSPASLSPKLKGGLADIAALGSNDLVEVNIIYEGNVQGVSTAIQQSGGFVKRTFTLGNIITAQIPANTLDLIARNNVQAVSLWPDRLFYSSLDQSVAQVNAPAMWQSGYTGQGMRIAILDSGIDTTHPMLSGRVIAQAVFTGDPSPMDSNGHGTHVAGIAAGKNPQGGNFFHGVARDAQLLNAKVLNAQGIGSESAIIAAINWALNPDNNTATPDSAHVISMSLGGPYSDPQSPISVAIDAAIAQGAVVVVSAGNCGPGCPAPECQGFVGVTTPGSTANAITVGAVDGFNNIACFSSGDIVNGTIKPDLAAPGVSIMSSWLGSIMQEQSGTSMAAPHVSGLAALLLQANPTLTPMQAKEIMEQTATDLGASGKDTSYGAGLVDGSKFLPSSVVSLLQYQLEIPLAITTNTPLPLTVTSSSGDVTSVTFIVLRPDGITFQFAVPSLVGQTFWQHTFTDTSTPGIYAISAHITTSANQPITLTKSTIAIPPQTTGFIVSITAPPLIEYGVEKNYTVVFNNTGGLSTDLITELQLWDNDLFEDIRFSQIVTVPPQSAVSVNIPWKPTKSVGERILRAVAVFGYQFAELQQNISIADTTDPILVNATYPISIYTNDTFYPQITIRDISDINGTLSITGANGVIDVPLMQLSRADDLVQLLSLHPVDAAGNYSFTMQLCDSWMNCINTSSYAFTAADCNHDRKFLTVLESGTRDDFATLQPNHCVSFWDRTMALPSDQYINRFPFIYWVSGNSWLNSISDDATNLLLNYSGSLVVEGAEIATTHIDDVLMDVFSAELNQSLLPGGTDQVQLLIARNHSLFDSLTSPITFNQTFSPAPDELLIKESIPLARWNEHGFALTASQHGSRKLLFIPFSTKALENVRNQFLTNIDNWIFRGEGPDLVIDYLDTPYLIEGLNQGIVWINNEGSASSTPARFEIMIDDQITYVSSPLIPLQPNQTVPTQASVPLVRGTHKLLIRIDSAQQLNESNSLNNDYLTSILVAPNEPNFYVHDISSSWNDGSLIVSAIIANYGGTTIINGSVSIGINSTSTTHSVSLSPGELFNLSTTRILPKANYDVSVLADPLNTIIEANESDNEQSIRLYYCTTYPVLIVDDSTSESETYSPSTASAWDLQLKEEGYCSTVMNLSAVSTPTLIELQNYKTIVWTTGEYAPDAINESDATLLVDVTRSLILEGDDVAFAFDNQTLLNDRARARYIDDIISVNTTSQFMLGNLFSSALTIDVNETAFPEKLQPLSGASAAATWEDSNASIIASITNTTTLLLGFTLHSLHNESQRAIIRELVQLAGQSNTEPRTPQLLTCNTGNCNATFTQPLSVACSGAIDWENDPLLYTIETRQGANTTWTTIGNHAENQSFLWDISAYTNPTTVTLRCKSSDAQLESPYHYSNETATLAYTPNTPPQIVQVNITPTQAYANNTLQCSATATDQQQTILNLTFSWLRNETIQPALSITVSANSGINSVSPLNATPLIKHDTWACQVSASDGTYSTLLNSTPVILLNAPPSEPTLFTPPNLSAFTTPTISFSYFASDIDNDPITYFITVGRLLSPNPTYPVVQTSLTTTLQTLLQGVHFWNVTASDGEVNSTPSEQRTFYIDSVPPAFLLLSTNPLAPHEDQNITFTALMFEQLPSTVHQAYLDWNGVNYSASQIGAFPPIFSVTLAPGTYTAHDTIPYRWHANDTMGNTNTSQILSITIANQIPLAVNLSLTSDSPTQSTHGNLTAGFAFFDADDEDTLTAYTVQWYINGTHAPSLDNFTTVHENVTHGGESWMFSVRVYDGFGWSLWSNSTALSIINTPPQIQVNNNLTKVATVPVNYYVNFSDAEQDPVALFINDTRFGSTVQGMTALFSWNTNITDTGYHTFSLTATDGELTTTATLTATILPLIACANGTTNLGAGAIFSPLRVNGDDGGANRTAVVSRLSFFNISLLQPPSGPNGSTYVLFVIPGTPTAAAENPYNLGTTCFPTLFQNMYPGVLFDTFGLTPFIGLPLLNATGTPFTQVVPPIGFPLNITIQGFILDSGSAAQFAASTTNAIMLQIV